jgi:arylsulfatase A-like enzyme
MDAVAAEGVLFENAYAPAPWTLPSLVSLMTSSFPCEHGVVVDGLQLSPAVRPLAERLRDAGYATASYFANAYAGPTSGMTRGFESSAYVNFADGQRIAPLLDALGDHRFFLFLHNVEPHDPYTAPRETVSRFGPVSAREHDRANELLLHYRQLTRADIAAGRVPGTRDNTAEQREAMAELRRLSRALSALYDGDVALADERLGSVRRALEARGLWDDTLFILLSDHGEEFSEHGGFQHDQSVYEELVHVPLVVRFPGGRFGGRRVRQSVSLVDVVPTLADFLGRPELASGGRGRSLMPQVRGAQPADGAAAVVSLRDNRKKYFRPFKRIRGDLNVALREGTWKAIWNAEPGRLELYDLARDPREKQDRAQEEPERSRRLQAAAEGWLEECRRAGAAHPAVPSGKLREEDRNALRALGYID